uniref:Uncharacterized protein n=1 Tax=Arcella intermedia TaxID=1963864 RepID=A0A6B2LN77_9EUKA
MQEIKQDVEELKKRETIRERKLEDLQRDLQNLTPKEPPAFQPTPKEQPTQPTSYQSLFTPKNTILFIACTFFSYLTGYYVL